MIKKITPKDLNRDPDIKEAIKETPVWGIVVKEALDRGLIASKILDPEGMVLETLEGDVNVKPSDVILFQKKGKGKYWTVSKKTFDEKFNKTSEKDITDQNKVDEGWTEVIPKELVQAWKIDEKFSVQASWGLQTSEDNGGMLVQRIDDKDDVWICSFEDWKNYTVIEE